MSWVTPLFLAGLAAVVIPLAIHLLPHRRHAVAALGTLRFLQQAVREGRRRRRLKDLLLLSLRLAIVSILALLFARPFLATPHAAGAGDRELVVLIDASGSMTGRLLGTTAFALARDEALEVLRGVPEETKVTVAAFAKDVVELTDVAAFEPTRGCGTDYRAALAWALDRLALSRSRQRHITLISDLQESGIPEAPFERWPLDVTVAVIEVGPAARWNRAIVSVRPATPIAGTALTFEVETAAAGAPPERREKITVAIDGEASIVTDAAAQSTVTRLAWKAPRTGVWRGVAILEPGDAFPGDDRRPFACVTRSPTPVLLVDGDPGRTPYRNETYFLEMAFSVAEQKGVPSAFAPVRREALGELDGVRVIALCNVARLAPDEATRLAASVRGGAGVVFFLGDKVDGEFYRELSAMGLFPGTFEKIEASSGAAPGSGAGGAAASHANEPLREWDASHPALAVFREREQGDLSRVQFRDAFRLLPRAGDRVLARLDNGAPAIIEGRLGRGRILVIGNPCDRDWSDWPQERVFLPLVRELFHYLARETAAAPGRGGADPDGIVRAVVEAAPMLGEARAPGVYGSDPTIVVAPDPSEFDPRPCDRRTFCRRLGLPEAAPAETEPEPDDRRPPARTREKELWLYLALMLLACLCLENYLADRG